MDDPLALPLDISTPSSVSLTGSTKVPNIWPTVTDVPYRLAIIGEAPGEDEESYKLPFVGASGKHLDTHLQVHGINRDACYVGNVCQYRPPGNKFEAFGWDSDPVREGRAVLLEDLRSFAPNCVLALGNQAMRFMSGEEYGIKDSGYTISEYRGSILYSDLVGCKYVGGYHPAAVLRDYKSWPLLRLDVKRAFEEAHTSTRVLPVRNFDLDLTTAEICHRLDSWPAGLEASIDIEGGLDGWTCIGVSSAANYAFIIAFGGRTHSEQAQIYQALGRFCYRIDIPKVLQNALYDRFVLAYGFNILIRNVRHDTMCKSWEIYPELPKGLADAASMWTREPQWKYLIAYSKKEQKKRALAGVDPATEIRNKHRACCIDCSVTLEISQKQDAVLTDGGLAHYNFNMSLQSAFLYMELRGLAYDKQTASLELGQVNAALSETATRLFTRVGYDLRGEKGSLSSTKLPKLLYQERGYPVQKKGRGANAKVTTDVEALLNLTKKFPTDPLLADILLHRKLESVKETLEVETDPDGRVRCAYNPVGTDTGRVNCKTSPTGSGANLQTITKKLRKLYRADPGYWLFQCDLSGADGWTVAARCLHHGDPTMWDDYCFGLKPAKILALMYTYGADKVQACSREELRAWCKRESVPGGACDSDGWLYFACKRVQHGTNYGMQETTMSTQIMKDSYKMTGHAIYLSPDICAALQRNYLVRYRGLYAWHAWARRCVREGRPLVTCSGHVRTFFGRQVAWDRKSKTWDADPDTWREYLAEEPQFNTTYATNTAAKRLWEDPDNRVGNRLRVEPLHQVHDALIGQFRFEDLDYALDAIPRWFRNTFRIADSDVTIPFEGAYGPSWGELGPDYGGGVILP